MFRQQSCVLLVTAHPDDEAMFFAPSLGHFVAHGSDIAVLCLSNGDAGGLGKVREKELYAACRVLQVPARNVRVVDHSQLRDGMATVWPEAVVAAEVEAALRERPCGTVVTFDAVGVSGHVNHRAVHRGVAALLAARGAALGVADAWQLVSLRLPRKFLSAADVSLSRALAPRGALVLAGGALRTSLSAMRAHASQWVWYRKLFVLLSSYTYVNTLAPLRVG
ncbi:MAG: N-acetylglucosaminylphosphatidylinositol de-N-acetylase family protein [Monoraphidium minutum]|nr:MAG: N-acetylglucosaminylphosphatidylinositol de-N-acetylase family protein [Monoraphidium minutum]